MTPDVVVDIGNSRIKWGWLNDARTFRMLSMHPDNREVWESKLPELRMPGRLAWAVASVHPLRLDRFVEWARSRGDGVALVDDRQALPIVVRVREPNHVGIDRLLGAVAANARRRPGCGAVTVDVGTAVTVNVIDPDGAFRGGAIFPGFRLMAQSLHQYTARLPFVDADARWEQFPAEDTETAIRVGLRHSVVGAVAQACTELMDWFGPPEGIDAFVTGGGATPHLIHVPGWTFQHVPTLNLEGIRLAAEALP